MYTYIYVYIYIHIIIAAVILTEPDVCPELLFSRAKQPFFSTDPDEVCGGETPCGIFGITWRGETPIVPSSHARRYLFRAVFNRISAL